MAARPMTIALGCVCASPRRKLFAAALPGALFIVMPRTASHAHHGLAPSALQVQGCRARDLSDEGSSSELKWFPPYLPTQLAFFLHPRFLGRQGGAVAKSRGKQGNLGQ